MMRAAPSSYGAGSTNSVLPVAQMVEVAEVIQGAYQHVMANLVGETKTHVSAFVAGFVLKEKPYLLVTPEGLEHVMQVVFGNAQVTDFVFTLLYTFGSRWGMSSERFQSLCANLATAAVPGIQLPGSQAVAAVPNALASRLASSSEEAYHLLVANPWLVVLMLLQLFIDVVAQKA